MRNNASDPCAYCVSESGARVRAELAMNGAIKEMEKAQEDRNAVLEDCNAVLEENRRLHSENERLREERASALVVAEEAAKQRDDWKFRYESDHGQAELARELRAERNDAMMESARLRKRLLRAEELLRTLVVFGGPPKPRSLAWDVTLNEARVFLDGGK